MEACFGCVCGLHANIVLCCSPEEVITVMRCSKEARHDAARKLVMMQQTQENAPQGVHLDLDLVL